MAANAKTWLSGLAAVKHGSQDQHGPNFFSRNLPTALVLLRATALYLQEVQAAYGMGLTGLGKFLSKSCVIYKTDITTYKPYITT